MKYTSNLPLILLATFWAFLRRYVYSYLQTHKCPFHELSRTLNKIVAIQVKTRILLTFCNISFFFLKVLLRLALIQSMKFVKLKFPFPSCLLIFGFFVRPPSPQPTLSYLDSTPTPRLLIFHILFCRYFRDC